MNFEHETFDHFSGSPDAVEDVPLLIMENAYDAAERAYLAARHNGHSQEDANVLAQRAGDAVIAAWRG